MLAGGDLCARCVSRAVKDVSIFVVFHMPVTR
jgi:hypothetical protein